MGWRRSDSRIIISSAPRNRSRCSGFLTGIIGILQTRSTGTPSGGSSIRDLCFAPCKAQSCIIEKALPMSDEGIGADQSPGEGSRAPEYRAGAGWPPHQVRQASLRDLRDAIMSNPDAVCLRFEAACLLAEMGRTLEARGAYLRSE